MMNILISSCVTGLVHVVAFQPAPHARQSRKLPADFPYLWLCSVSCSHSFGFFGNFVPLGLHTG